MPVYLGCIRGSFDLQNAASGLGVHAFILEEKKGKKNLITFSVPFVTSLFNGGCLLCYSQMEKTASEKLFPDCIFNLHTTGNQTSVVLTAEKFFKTSFFVFFLLSACSIMVSIGRLKISSKYMKYIYVHNWQENDILHTSCLWFIF